MGNSAAFNVKRALKEVTVQQLETAIAAALYKITAHHYLVDIRHFDLELGLGSTSLDGGVIEMQVTEASTGPMQGHGRIAADSGQ